MDDFVYIHINQSNYVHRSGLFLPWHRQFTWGWEEALREHCSYQGSIPYWDWMPWAANQSESPVWSGGKDGFGTNGPYYPHGPVNVSLPDVPGPLYVYRDPGTGGGCVRDGAFSDFIANIGPSITVHAADDPFGLAWNPHCLRHDFSQPESTEALSYDLAGPLMQTADIDSFRPLADTIHRAAHAWPGGDPWDFYSSPSHPVFYLLHSQVDRLWTIWQGLDYTNRQNALSGTVTISNQPPSANATLDTILIMGAAGGNLPIKEVMSTISDGMCYIYE